MTLTTVTRVMLMTVAGDNGDGDDDGDEGGW